MSKEGINLGNENTNYEVDRFEGNIIIESEENIEELILPKEVIGNVIIRNPNIKSLTLPESIKGFLTIRYPEAASYVKFSKEVHGDVTIDDPENAEKLRLSEYIGGSLVIRYMDISYTVDGLELPIIVTNNLVITNIVNAKGLVFPKYINGNLELHGLKDTESLNFDDTNVGGTVFLPNTEEEDFKKLQEKYPKINFERRFSSQEKYNGNS